MSLKFDHLVAAQDLEQAQYESLAALQRIQRAFTRNEVFPHLAEMVRLKRDMERFVAESDQIRDAIPRRISGVDWEEGIGKRVRCATKKSMGTSPRDSCLSR